MLPGVYTGQANLTTLASRVTDAAGNGSMFEIVYHCQNCLQWNQDGKVGNVSTSNGGSALGRAAAKLGPTNAGCPSQISFGFHDNGYGQFTAQFANATSENYNTWAALPAKPVTLASGCSAATNATRYVNGTVITSGFGGMGHHIHSILYVHTDSVQHFITNFIFYFYRYRNNVSKQQRRFWRLEDWNGGLDDRRCHSSGDVGIIDIRYGA